MYLVWVDTDLRMFYSKPLSSWACDNITDSVLDQYETLQYAVIYLSQT